MWIIEYLQEVARDLFQHCCAQIEGLYETERLRCETLIRVTKIGVANQYKGSLVDIVTTGLNKIGPSFLRLLRTPKFIDVQFSQDDHLHHNQINTFDRFRPMSCGEPEDDSRDPFAPYMERKRLEREAQQQEANPYARKPRTVFKQGRGRGSSHHRCPSPAPAPPQPSYLSTLPPPDPRRQPADFLQLAREKLGGMISEERLNLGVGYPSGHTGIDPVIAAYNEERIQQQAKEHRAAVRRAVAEHKQQQAEEAKAREQIEIVINFARTRYVHCVGALAGLAPKLNEAIDLLESVILANNRAEIIRVANAITLELIAPIIQSLEDMAREIPLEEEGAQILRAQWPCDRLEMVFTYLKAQSGLPDELEEMCQGIQAMCEPLLNPTPFGQPREVKPVQQSRFTTGTASSNYTMPLAHGPPVFAPAPTPAQDTTSNDTSSGPNFSSFSALINATKTASQPSTPTSVLANVALPSGAPVFAAPSSTTTAPTNSFSTSSLASALPPTGPSVFAGTGNAPSSTAPGHPFLKYNFTTMVPGAAIPPTSTATNSGVASSSSSSSNPTTTTTTTGTTPSSNYVPAPQTQTQNPTPTSNPTDHEAPAVRLALTTLRPRANILLARANLTLIGSSTGHLNATVRSEIIKALKPCFNAANGQRGLISADSEAGIKKMVLGIQRLLDTVERKERDRAENVELERVLDGVLGVWREGTTGVFV